MVGLLVGVEAGVPRRRLGGSDRGPHSGRAAPRVSLCPGGRAWLTGCWSSVSCAGPASGAVLPEWARQPPGLSLLFRKPSEQRHASFCDGDSDVPGEAPFPGPLREDTVLSVPGPLPKPLWEATEVGACGRAGPGSDRGVLTPGRAPLRTESGAHRGRGRWPERRPWRCGLLASRGLSAAAGPVASSLLGDQPQQEPGPGRCTAMLRAGRPAGPGLRASTTQAALGPRPAGPAPWAARVWREGAPLLPSRTFTKRTPWRPSACARVSGPHGLLRPWPAAAAQEKLGVALRAEPDGPHLALLAALCHLHGAACSNPSGKCPEVAWGRPGGGGRACGGCRRRRSPLCSPLPHNGQNTGLPSLLGALSAGGSLPDLTHLHCAAPLPASLDTSDHLFGSMSMGSSVGNLPAAMTHLGIRSFPGLQTSRSNPSIQAALGRTALCSPSSHPHAASLGASPLQPSLRLFSLSNPSLSTASLSGPPRRRQPPVSPLTLSPGPEPHPGFSRQLSTASPLNHCPAQQVSTGRARGGGGPVLMSPCRGTAAGPSPTLTAPSLPKGSPVTSFFPDVNFDQQPLQPGPAFAPQVPLAQQGPQEAQDPFRLRPSLYSSCGNFQNSILAEDPHAGLFRELGSVPAAVPEAGLSVGAPCPLEDELHMEPLGLDSLSMLSDPGMGLLDPSVEETFRADRL
ncbi:PREDICTED: CREB-regulated transcription coactivator 3 [Condylura cristata]|uniref:CREB-regulated transcription coactivator 3 n=1 Tax=Condylura cristata TaxID=143302 RepID=UPI0006434B86|nr:PREDICTED: CREB-regulated transcription coactivator 3 [Condylura cristata]